MFMASAGERFLCSWGVQERGFCVHGECRREVFVSMGSAGERFLCSWGVQERGFCVHGECRRLVKCYSNQ